MKRAIATTSRALIVVCLLIPLVSCVRPDKGPSPFDALSEPTPQPKALPESPLAGPAYALIPDAELVFSPTTVGFDISAEIKSHGGTLAEYTEIVDEECLTGAQILERVAWEYSLHPRILLAVLQYTSGWVAGDNALPYPIYTDTSTDMILFRQLSWAANTLNFGYYSRRVGGLPAVTTLDGVEIILSREVNDATAALQYFLAQLTGYYEWEHAVGSLGIRAAYAAMFGDPFAQEFSPLIPEDLTQPQLLLPFSEGESWFYTSGPHSGWGTGSAWAALDFAPDEGGWGCYEATSWVTAAADGVVARVGDGIVVQDLDDDGEEGTGWTILYMHIAEDGKVELGQQLQAGDPIGHPSCAGGPATGTHLHIARRYNGEWIPADQDIPFNLSGWVSRGDGLEYDGTLLKGELAVEAAGFPTDENKVTH